MSLIEFIGFIITFFAFIIMSLRRMKEKRQMEANPNEEDEDDEALRDYLRSIGIEVEERPKPPPPPIIEDRPEALRGVTREPIREDTFNQNAPMETFAAQTIPEPSARHTFKTNIENRKFKSRIEEKKLKSEVEEREYRSSIEDKGYIGTLSEAPAYEVLTSDDRLSLVDTVINEQDLKNLVISNIILGPPKAYE
ncbi:MAG: hypothetical protein ACK4HV_03220 [Parachlamydiaceae bacterium]